MTSPQNKFQSKFISNLVRNRVAAKHAPLIASLVSGIILALAFIPFEWSFLVWMALVPLILSVAAVSPRRAFALGFCGLSLYWLITIFWLTRVTVIGWLLLSLYCGIYGGIFAWLAQGIFQVLGTDHWGRNTLIIAMLSAAWAALEWMRSTFLSGFSWNPLAAALYNHGVLIQLAELGGVYLLSALIVLFNVALALIFHRHVRRRARAVRTANVEMVVVVVALAAAFVWGFRALRQGRDAEGSVLRVAMIQPNIEQEYKWDQEQKEHIWAQLRDLTAAAASVPELDVIIWPETALPDFLRSSRQSSAIVEEAAAHGVPLLIGSMDFDTARGREPLYYNSAMLVDTEGEIRQRYAKQHLVPFGEYVPLGSVLPFLRSFSPFEGDITPGLETKILHLGEAKAPSAVLICFEDVIARLSINAARAGARLLVNITNDAWFDPLWASRQHRALSVFRSVETRLPLIRCANTGMTCWIDQWGIIVDEMEPLMAGFMTANVFWIEDTYTPTLYVRFGDRFAHICMILTLSLAFWILWRRSKFPVSKAELPTP